MKISLSVFSTFSINKGIGLEPVPIIEKLFHSLFWLPPYLTVRLPYSLFSSLTSHKLNYCSYTLALYFSFS